jgi:hypothetical protein
MPHSCPFGKLRAESIGRQETGWILAFGALSAATRQDIRAPSYTVNESLILL